MEKNLYRSRENKMIAGVCGGVAEYFSVDPTIVRIIWAAVTLAYVPAGIVAYIVAAIVMPEKQAGYSGQVNQQDYEAGENGQTSYNDGVENYGENSEHMREPAKFDSHRTRLVIGGGLVLLGALFLAKEFFYFDWRYIWPLIFIGVGTVIIYKGGRK